MSDFRNGGADVMGRATLLDTLVRTPGTPREAADAVARRLVDGRLELTGSFAGRSREIGREVLADAR